MHIFYTNSTDNNWCAIITNEYFNQCAVLTNGRFLIQYVNKYEYILRFPSGQSKHYLVNHITLNAHFQTK